MLFIIMVKLTSSDLKRTAKYLQVEKKGARQSALKSDSRVTQESAVGESSDSVNHVSYVMDYGTQTGTK